jgi:hypothetical protein
VAAAVAAVAAAVVVAVVAVDSQSAFTPHHK